METIQFGDGELIELEAVRRPFRGVRFDLTNEDEELELQHYPEHTHALQRSSWSSSTKRVLSSMPSRSMKWNQETALSQYQSRSTRTRRRQPVSTVSTCPADQDVFIDHGNCTDEETQQFIKKLQGSSAGERVRVLRQMPLSVSEKRQIRAAFSSCEDEQPGSDDRGLYYRHCLLKSLCGGGLKRLFQLMSIQLWQKVLKKICGRFGTGVQSYFIFLRRLLHYNILLFLINSIFLILPQILNKTPSFKAETNYFWILTGRGILTDSVMYYGHYANSTCSNCVLFPKHYKIHQAYAFTIGIGMFVTCALLVYSMSKSFGKSFCTLKTTGNLALKVFCSWDFKVIKKRSVRLQSVNICIQIKEMLAGLSCKKRKGNLSSTLGWLTVHSLVWFICLLCIAVCMAAVYFFHLNLDKDDSLVSLLTLPLVMSCISHVLPGFFDMISSAERYSSPNIHIYVSIIRNLLLKCCIFGILCYYWLQKIIDQNDKVTIDCWETFVGQQLYRFVLMDLIFAMLYIVLSEFLWGLCIRNCTLRRRKLQFNIAHEVLELIYGQTLVWFGVLFSPLLPAMQIGKLFVLFYFKKTSLMMNFQPPRKHWRATQMNTLFICLLFFPSFTGALTCVIYALWRIKPSSKCGPFVNQAKNILTINNHWFNDICLNPLFLFSVASLLVTILYIHIQIMDGQKRIIERLQKQIDYEGEDKKFLIAKIQALNEPNAQQ